MLNRTAFDFLPAASYVSLVAFGMFQITFFLILWMEKQTSKFCSHFNKVSISEDEEAAMERKIERARRRALQSSLIQDLRAQYSEAPEEFQVSPGNGFVLF